MGLNFEQEVVKRLHLSSEEFIEQFPYKDYLAKYPINNIILLESHRYFLENQNIDSDDFIEALINCHVEMVSFDFIRGDSIKKLIQTSEILSHSKSYLPDSVSIYMVASDIIFEAIADTLETMIKEKTLDMDDFNVKYIIQRLIDNQYVIALPPNNWEKFWKYIKEGRWEYIWHKFTTTYLKEFIVAIITGISFLGLLIWIGVRYKKKKKKKIAKNLLNT